MSASDLAVVVITLAVGPVRARRSSSCSNSSGGPCEPCGPCSPSCTSETAPLVAELDAAVTEANQELDRVDQLIGSAESISATVDATSRLAYKALSAPMIKTVAIASGTSKAAKRLAQGEGADVQTGDLDGNRAAMGAGSAFWAKRKVTRAVERYMPDEVAQRAGASARTMGRTVRDAAPKGAPPMREREAELRAKPTPAR